MHNHNWRSLYTLPTDSHFLQTYNSTGLNQWYICECGAIGKGTEAIKPVLEKQQAARKVDAVLWNRTLKVVGE